MEFTQAGLKVLVRGAYRSLTLRINAGWAVVLSALPYLPELLPQLSALLPKNIYAWVAVAILLSNILLRTVTSTSLSEKGRSETT
jgi:hypothetical protein